MWRFGFFDAVETAPGVYDRVYNAEEFSVPFSALIDTGVLEGAGDSLEVTTDGSSMQTTIGTGVAFIRGRYAENTSPREHTHDTETVGVDRIDRIVVRLDLRPEARHVESFVKKGVASANPVPPALQRDENVYEISLAQVRIRGGQTFISPSDITDERGDENICPWARSKVLPHIDSQDVVDLRQDVVDLRNDFENHVLKTPAQDNVHGLRSDRLAIGQNSEAPNSGAVAIGNNAKSLDFQGIAIGASAVAESENSIVIGTGALAFPSDRTNAIAIGTSARSGLNSISLGNVAMADEGYSAAIGSGAITTAEFEGVLGADSVDLNGPLSWRVPGNFSVQGTKSFVIDHPHPDKKETHHLRHGAVESPTPGENLYRYEVEAIEDGQTVEVELPDYFQYLNTNVQVFVSPVRHFGRAYGETEGNTLKVTCETAGKYNVMVIGTRNDERVQDWYIMGAEKEKGITWRGETEAIDIHEIMEITEITEIEEVDVA